MEEKAGQACNSQILSRKDTCSNHVSSTTTIKFGHLHNFLYICIMKYKQNRKLVEVSCDHCGTIHTKPETEFKRNQARGRKNYCSRSCVGKANIGINIPKETRVWTHLEKYKDNCKDEFTGFRVYLRRTKKRDKDFDLDLPYLKELFESQDGTCPYSGVKLTLALSKKKNDQHSTASLDRIDSSKGYIKGNVQFVSITINLMKNSMTHDETVEFCKIITEFWKDKSL